MVTAAVSASSVSSSRKKKSAMNYVGAALRLKPVKVTEQVMVYRCLIIYNYLSVYCIALFIIVSVGSCQVQVFRTCIGALSLFSD